MVSARRTVVKVITLTLMVVLIGVLAAAQAASQPPPGAQLRELNPLHWNWGKQEYLTGKQSIGRNKNLAPPERERLVVAIAARLRDGIASEEELRRVAAETRIKYVDLDQDGKPEVIAQAGEGTHGCSPTGNCTFWVLRGRGPKYEVLLEALAQTFTVQPTRTNHFSDIVLNIHGSAFETEAREYKFDNNTYRETDCYDVLWASCSDDDCPRLTKPRFTRCGSTR